MSDTWLVGATATRAERLLVYAGGAVVAALVWWAFLRPQTGWSWWQQAVAIVIALDLCSGAVANAANSTKAQYQQDDSRGLGARFVRNPVAFAALHVYPLLVVLLYPDGTWPWGIGWYVGMLIAIVIVDRIVPSYLQRPAAMLLFVLGVIAALVIAAPPGWEWLPYVYLAKLLLGHAVAEKPIRPKTIP